MDEKKVSNDKDSSNHTSSSSKSLFSRSFSTRSFTSNSPLLRSLSQKGSSSSKCNDLPRSYSQKNHSIGHKYTNLAKEQKARFYTLVWTLKD
ncbi:hypothetical protein SESBI_38017 [Sesbania bispinosa]|nr:hypothetical protein SESBI_38017 [Sesbania bispinosa]